MCFDSQQVCYAVTRTSFIHPGRAVTLVLSERTYVYRPTFNSFKLSPNILTYPCSQASHIIGIFVFITQTSCGISDSHSLTMIGTLPTTLIDSFCHVPESLAACLILYMRASHSAMPVKSWLRHTSLNYLQSSLQDTHHLIHRTASMLISLWHVC